jgi:predicted RNA-binding protein
MVAPETPERTYWVQIFTPSTWHEFLKAGGAVTGFRPHRWGLIQKIKPGDWLLCYLTGIGRWIGTLEVRAEPYLDESRIWKDEVFPCRAEVRVMVALTLDTAVPIRDLKSLSIFRQKNWGVHLITSPTRWKPSDAEVVIAAVEKAQKSIVRG